MGEKMLIRSLRSQESVVAWESRRRQHGSNVVRFSRQVSQVNRNFDTLFCRTRSSSRQFMHDEHRVQINANHYRRLDITLKVNKLSAKRHATWHEVQLQQEITHTYLNRWKIISYYLIFAFFKMLLRSKKLLLIFLRISQLCLWNTPDAKF